MTRAQKATQLMLDDKFACSQSILEVFCDDFGVDVMQARKLSALFGGGMKRGDICGLVTGALMVLGLKYGQTQPLDLETKKACGPVAREFISRFEAKGHKLTCEGIMGVNTSTPEGAKYSAENKLHETLCPKALEDAIGILEDMLGL